MSIEVKQEILEQMLNRVENLRQHGDSQYEEITCLQEQISDVLMTNVGSEPEPPPRPSIEEDLLNGLGARVYLGSNSGEYIILPSETYDGVTRLNRQRYVYPYETTFYNGSRYLYICTGNSDGRFYFNRNQDRVYLPRDLTCAFLAKQYRENV